MPKEIRMLSVKTGTPSGDAFINWLLKFKYTDLIICPKEKRFDYRVKKEYTSNEKRILKLLYNVKNSIHMYCPIVCSGRRGDGSSYRRRCRYFKGYGKNKENVWSFREPKKYVLCSKSKTGKIYVKKITHDCEKRRLALAVARKLKLVHEFGCASLENTPIEECLKCDYKTEEGCGWKPKCKKGERGLLIYTKCDWGDCDTCEEINARNKGRKMH